MEPDLAHDAVEQEGGAGHVARVFQKADKEKEKEDLGEEDNNTAYATDHAIHEEAGKLALGEEGGYGVAQPAREAVYGVHEGSGEGEDAPEEHGHDDAEDTQTVERVEQVAV